jgi:hypothetical protein
VAVGVHTPSPPDSLQDKPDIMFGSRKNLIQPKQNDAHVGGVTFLIIFRRQSLQRTFYNADCEIRGSLERDCI